MQRIRISNQRLLIAFLWVLANATLVFGSVHASAEDGQALVNAKCSACHASSGKGRWDRISDGRRTPEGWDMTVARMSYAHGLKVSRDERASIVKFLADEFGLAPEESAPYRYILEKRPSIVESPGDKLIGETCARCHSYARIALQRRTENEWRKLVHFHVGQYPVIEIQAGGRDRNWFEIADGEVSASLGKRYGLVSDSWQRWRTRPTKDLSGTWRVAGHQPGRGAYDGEARIARVSDDRYNVSVSYRFANGSVETGVGSAVVYTGFEWRATLKQGEREVNQVMTVSGTGMEISGRWFDAAHDSIGGFVRGVRVDVGGSPTVLALHPEMIKAGERGRIAIVGTNLNGEVRFGPDVTVRQVVESSKERLVVEVDVNKDASEGARSVSVGHAQSPNLLKVYRKVDYLKITPEHPMARVGGGGGAMEKVPVQLEAVGFSNGADGKRGTEDDLKLGVVPAKWSKANLNRVAEEMKDSVYAGELSGEGLFTPSVAGPNPIRKFKTNNAGELRVTASYKDGARTVNDSVPLIVTVQRFNDPPIR